MVRALDGGQLRPRADGGAGDRGPCGGTPNAIVHAGLGDQDRADARSRFPVRSLGSGAPEICWCPGPGFRAPAFHRTCSRVGAPAASKLRTSSPLPRKACCYYVVWTEGGRSRERSTGTADLVDLAVADAPNGQHRLSTAHTRNGHRHCHWVPSTCHVADCML
jgi:hypothetical protein